MYQQPWRCPERDHARCKDSELVDQRIMEGSQLRLGGGQDWSAANSVCRRPASGTERNRRPSISIQIPQIQDFLPWCWCCARENTYCCRVTIRELISHDKWLGRPLPTWPAKACPRLSNWLGEVMVDLIPRMFTAKGLIVAQTATMTF